jgi:hypothetical protein
MWQLQLAREPLMRSLQLLSGQNPAYLGYLRGVLNADNAKLKKNKFSTDQLCNDSGGYE